MKRLGSFKGSGMTLFFLLLSILSNSTIYYSKITGNANTLGAWGSSPDGSGGNPLNFTTSGDVFILRTGAVLDLSGPLIIGSGVTLQMDGTLIVTTNNHDITIHGTIFFTNPSSTQLYLNGGGNGNNFTLGSGALLKTANLNGIRGNNCSLPAVVSGAVTFNSAASYEFTGNGTQACEGLPSTLLNLVVNANQNCHISSNTTVTGTITLTQGVLNIQPGATLTLSSGTVIAGSNFGPSKHINTGISSSNKGYLRVNGISSAYTFPVGNGTYYLPVTLSPGATSDVRVNVFQGLTSNGEPAGTPFTIQQKQTVVDAVWQVERLNGSGAATLTLQWDNALEGSLFSSFANSEIGISQFSGSAWDPAMGSGNQLSNTATRPAISNLNIFAVGKVGVALPLKFADLRLSSQGNTTRISWTALNEMNVSRYEIERSVNGRDYSVTGSIPATGNGYAQTVYSWTDQYPLLTTSLYRIKAVDLDGDQTYSSILRISFNGDAERSWTIYPNPVTGNKIMLQVFSLNEGCYKIFLADSKGSAICQKVVELKNLSETIEFNLPSKIPAGVYYLYLSGENWYQAKMIIIKN